ncbi:MAG: hypothetical protein ACTSQ8_23375 [Candidatus Helarchaeota archaeon]
MKILILNWRDIKHPAAGGAEAVTYEIAKRWVQWGNEVTSGERNFQSIMKPFAIISSIGRVILM